MFVDPEGFSRASGDGSKTGKGTANPRKHCSQHPTKPGFLSCTDKDGKTSEVKKPKNWDEDQRKKEEAQKRKVKNKKARKRRTIKSMAKACEKLPIIGFPIGLGYSIGTGEDWKPVCDFIGGCKEAY